MESRDTPDVILDQDLYKHSVDIQKMPIFPKLTVFVFFD